MSLKEVDEEVEDDLKLIKELTDGRSTKFYSMHSYILCLLITLLIVVVFSIPKAEAIRVLIGAVGTVFIHWLLYGNRYDTILWKMRTYFLNRFGPPTQESEKK
jgi:uncharacterized membrane protein